MVISIVKDKYPTLVLALVFIAKAILYRHLTGMDAWLSSGQVASAYLCVFAAGMALATLAWLPRRWPAVVVCVLADLWCLAGIWYWRANILWLTWAAVRTINELPTFLPSVLVYIAPVHVWFPLTTIVAVAVLYLFPYRPVSWRAWVGMVVAVVLLCAGGAVSRQLNPLSEEDRMRTFDAEQEYFISTHSPLAQVALVGKQAVREGIFHWSSSRPFTAREQEILAPFENRKSDIEKRTSPTAHLIFILVESMETWAIEACDSEGGEVCHCLNAYLRSHHVLYVPHLETQQRYGRSGDGQLITQTGLLPISFGVACREYGENTYPNFAHFYDDGVVLNPYLVQVWNQGVVTYSYGYRRLISPTTLGNQTDSIIMDEARTCLSDATGPTSVLALTLDTHVPFRSQRDRIPLDDTYSETERNYLMSMHYTDRHIGRFLAWADTAAVMKGATIVITADHNHFPRTADRGWCPLFIASPCIKQSLTLPSALQMDIFPTVLHAIGQQQYAWQGFGIDLLQVDAPALLNNRPVSPQEAYELSDKMISTDYFFR